MGDATASIRPRLEVGDATTMVPRDVAATRSSGNVFGAYHVLEQLGIGGMASVHRAVPRDGTPRAVALKRLLPVVAADPSLVQLFLDESQLVSTLRHRNIAEVYESGQVGEDYFLTMELVTGPTVKKLVRHCESTVGLMPFPIVITILAQVCEALAYAHDHCDDAGQPLHLVHRDVSPSNIVISADGIVKLIDFGIAKTIGTNTQAGIVKGKLGYVAPEYIQGSLDRRADLWGLGVVAWELLTNTRLFSAEGDLTLLQKVMSQPIEPPSTYNPDVAPELDAVVMTALERDPDRRWQNATALRNALLGVARPSSNDELVEWVEWVFKLAERGLRPVRGSRRLQPVKPMHAVRLVLPDADIARLESDVGADPVVAEPIVTEPVVAAPVVAAPTREPSQPPVEQTAIVIGRAMITRHESKRIGVWIGMGLVAVATAIVALVYQLV